MDFPIRGEVYDIDFGPVGTAEIGKVRPGIVIQNNIGNKYASTVIVAAIRGNLKVTELPVGVLIKKGEGELKKDSAIDLGHIQTIDKRRLIKLRGKVPSYIEEKVNKAIMVSLGLETFKIEDS